MSNKLEAPLNFASPQLSHICWQTASSANTLHTEYGLWGNPPKEGQNPWIALELSHEQTITLLPLTSIPAAEYLLSAPTVQVSRL